MAGKPPKYGITRLAIGESCLCEWEREKVGGPATNARSIQAQLSKQRRRGKKFETEFTIYGMWVKRIE